MSIENIFDYDLIAIGGGSGGLACVKEANKFGAKVLCVDYVKPTPKGHTWGIGGACVNVGCIPKKLMQHTALLGDEVHDATFYGWQVPNEENIILNWSYMVTEIQNQTKSTNWLIKVELRSSKITYINGMASFVNENTLKIKKVDGKELTVTAQYIVVAIGLRPTYPNIPGDREYGITSDDLFGLQKPPGKTLIVGASYISMECSGFLRLFGFDVTVMVREKVLRNFDQQMAKILVDSLKERGVKFLIPYRPLKVEQMTNKSLLVTYENSKTLKQQSQTYDTVMWAIGREGHLKDLNLEAINLITENGKIVVSHEDCTNVANIYAVGDISKGRPQLTPVAAMAGRFLARRLFTNSTQIMNYQNVATSVFTPLTYAFVGMSEESAIEQYGEDNIEVYHNYYSPIEFALPGKIIDYCYIKLIAKREEDQLVLGIHFIGPNAADIVQGFSVALNCGITIKTLFNTVFVTITNAEEILNTFITKRSGLDPKPLMNV